MLESAHRKKCADLRWLISAIHTSKPRDLMDSLDPNHRAPSPHESLADLARLTGQPQMAQKIELTTKAVRILAEMRERKDGR